MFMKQIEKKVLNMIVQDAIAPLRFLPILQLSKTYCASCALISATNNGNLEIRGRNKNIVNGFGTTHHLCTFDKIIIRTRRKSSLDCHHLVSLSNKKI